MMTYGTTTYQERSVLSLLDVGGRAALPAENGSEPAGKNLKPGERAPGDIHMGLLK